MKKYYIGFFVLLAVTVAALAYTVSQAGAAKQDKITDQAVEQFATKIEEYSANHGSVPKNLSDMGISNSSNVTYTQLGDSKYKVCFNYHTASSGFDAGWASLLFGGITGRNQEPLTGTQGSYFDSSVQTNHKKGQNCQTVENNIFGSETPSTGLLNNSGGASCDIPQNYKISGSATVASINTTSKQITFSPQNQFAYDSNGNQATLSTVSYDDSTAFCDSSYKKTDVSSVQAGKSVTVYLSSSTDNKLLEIDTY